MNIPKQLQCTEFRFYLIGTDSKLPIEKEWTTKNNYRFFDPKLLAHQGNYGVIGGPGNLIIIDFDNRDYYEEVKNQLPRTFTVLSAGRKLPHLYYLLDGDMFKKTNIRGEDNKVLADIQAQGAGVVGPGSTIGRRYYSVVNDVDIATITSQQIQDVLKVYPERKVIYNRPSINNPEKVELAIRILSELKIKRTKNTLFQCPFHAMAGQGNLSIMPNGFLYCFHEVKCWHDISEFLREYKAFIEDKYGKR